MSCCIQNHPLTFVENCGADPFEAARILSALEKLGGDAQTATMATQHEAEAAEGDVAKEDDFANNAHLPEWKQECIRTYVACQTEPDWRGSCYACLRRCEGQQQWPFKMRSPPGE
ncbi:hypothetical protein [Hyalangium sp.]|uniref:hypothetical protein n=1 Tax=Hyalangium sp. TaxID=2028555 RepID=UPI002D4945B8|nr:hypothetical protein [Hyalangium sp.]HYH95446.1 hypothetical protein [Hyalangium sp.]